MKPFSRQATANTPVAVESWETRWFECKIRRRLDELPGAVVILHNGMIVEMNARTAAILERPAEQILHHHLEEFTSADEAPKLARWLGTELLSPLLVGAVRAGKSPLGLWLQQHGHFIYRGRRVCMTSLIPDPVRTELQPKPMAC